MRGSRGAASGREAVLSESERQILYLTQTGLTEALGRRQVLPYLVGLAGRGWRITVVSFEKERTAHPEAVSGVARITAEAGIAWRMLRYHGRPPVLATAYDALRGCGVASRRASEANLIHARSTVPALMASLLSRRHRIPWVFDLRGLLAEEYVDAGHWRRGSLRERITKAVETRLLRSASGVVTLTRRAALRLPEPVDAGRPLAVVPCSVDLATFRPSAPWRETVRRELQWSDRPLLVYSGSLGSWYRHGEMLDFFEVARKQIEGLCFLVLSPHASRLEPEIGRRRLEGSAIARSIAPDDVPRHLAAADAGICFLGRHTSKEASSPTKYGEYLAAGLPVVTNGWIGDARVLEHEPTWLLVDEFAEPAYRRAATGLAHLLADAEATRRAARDLAVREFALEAAVERYADLYAKILAR